MPDQRPNLPFPGSVVLGTWIFGGRPPHRAPLDTEVSSSILKSSRAAGVDWIDTAGVYGLGSVECSLRSEAKSNNAPRILTKCGIDWSENDGQVTISHRSDPSAIDRQVDEARGRLGVDTIDALLIHWPDAFGSPIEGSWEKMVALREAGTVRACGLSNFEASDIRRLARLGSIDITQFSWTSPTVSDLFEASAAVSATPMVYGVLRPFLDRIDADVPTRSSVEHIARRHSVSIAALLLGFALHRRPRAAFVLGASSASQFESTMAGSTLALEQDEVESLMRLLEIDSANDVC